MTIWIPNLSEEDIPLYRRLADAVERDIYAGRLKPGDRLPTHRDLADTIGVNVSTVTRGYREAERRGLVSSTVGRGTYVSSGATTSTALVSPEPHAPGMLELGIATPFYGMGPNLTKSLSRLARRKIEGYLRYTDPAGLPEHREAGAAWAGRYGMECTGEDIVVCAGAQHALTCCLTALFSPGDRVATESLTYPGIKSLARILGLRLAPIPMDAEGMIPEELDTACRRESIQGLYLIPGVQNPTLACMSDRRRDLLADIIGRHNLTLIEDDALGLTHPGLPAPVSMRIPERSVFIAGVSKSFGAGLRVSFAAAPGPLRRRIAETVLYTMWMTPTLNAAIVSMWIEDGTADRVLAAMRKEAARRTAIAERLLSDHRFVSIPCGFFIWLHLPPHRTGKEFEARAREAGVNIFCAEKFVVGDTPMPQAVRVSLSGTASIGDLSRGLTLLADLLSRDRWETIMVL